MNIKLMPAQERPRERLEAYGPEALSLAELLAILLATGTQNKPVLVLAHELLAHFGGLTELLDASLEELRQIKGIGHAKALQLQAAFALAKRAKEPLGSAKIPLNSSADAYRAIKEFFLEEKQEVLAVLLRDVKGRAYCLEKVGMGTLSSILVHPREVFYPAIRQKAHSMILAHNHPSGDPKPSEADLHWTLALENSGKVMGISLDDHLIIGAGQYFSFYERGLLGQPRKHY